MGKRLIQQARGKGGPTYRAPSFKYKGVAGHRALRQDAQESVGMVMDIIKCRGHSAPLMIVEYDDGFVHLVQAPDGIKVGDTIECGAGVEVKIGNSKPLSTIIDGTLVYNLEGAPGDGGKYCRAGGTYAKVLAHTPQGVLVMLPSKKERVFSPGCRAIIGIIANGGLKEKPFVKAGNKYHYMRARNKLYPIVGGTSMNATDHPFGNSRSYKKARAKPAPKNAPPGRNVGLLHPRRTGRRKK